MVPGRVKGFNSDGQHGQCRLRGPKGLFLCCNFLCSFFVLNMPCAVCLIELAVLFKPVNYGITESILFVCSVAEVN